MSLLGLMQDGDLNIPKIYDWSITRFGALLRPPQNVDAVLSLL